MTIDRSDVVNLTDADAERLHNQIVDLFKLADELGIKTVTIYAHKVTGKSAFHAFPAGVERISVASSYRSYTTWTERVGGHEVILFGGDVDTRIVEASE